MISTLGWADLASRGKDLCLALFYKVVFGLLAVPTEDILPALIVEQIIAYGRRIVQIMIQATDLAQILYRGHPSRKKRRPRKISIWPPFSKMATMGYPENVFFALNGQQMVGKDNNENRFYVLSIANVQIMS